VSEVRKATLLDADVLSTVLAAAFGADPVMNWVFPDPAARPGQLGRLFVGLAHAYLPDRGTVHVLEDASASFWRSPGFDNRAADDVPAQDAEPSPLGLSAEAMRRLQVLGTAVAAVHPPSRHWYLNVLGTSPERQGEGLGARVLQPVLSVCDTDGSPAYLESSNAANIPFYRRLGFEPTGEITLPDGPSLYPMWRDPRS
jgi:GNAT superfamily N-acetyltransferase